MKQNVAPTGLSIRIITLSVLLLTLGMFIGAFFEPGFLWIGIALAVIVSFCYLLAPIEYELHKSQLAIITRINKKIFSPVRNCSTIHEEKPSFGLRLWGNGGLFAGTGIFWNRKYGIFRAYVTTGDRKKLILVETPATKILITPEDPDQFVSYVNSSKTPGDQAAPHGKSGTQNIF
jgi:hypothetical protein